MSKVLIDRDLLERAVYSLELAYEADTPTVRGIAAVLTTPSGTPELPVKAYYHEAPNEHGGLNKSVGLEVRKTFSDAPLVLESDALVQIACLEGEIAKRDAELCERTEEVEHALADLNNALAELAAIKAQEPVELEYPEYHAEGMGCGLEDRGITDRYEAMAYGFQEAVEQMATIIGSAGPLYAAPVSEAKAQGVVMPEQDGSDAQIAFWAGFEFAVCGLHNNDIRAAWNDFKSSERFKRLAAAPAAPAADACKACNGTGRRPIGGRGKIFGLTNRCFECHPVTAAEFYGVGDDQ